MYDSQFKPVLGTSFIEFRPSGHDFKLASEKAERMGVLANSFTKGEGRMAGFLGEAAVEKFLYGLVADCSENTRWFDFQSQNGMTLEIKTKKTSAIPKPDYTASVEKKATAMFKNDLFVFLRCHNSLAKLWILGWMRTPHFKKVARFKKAGETEESSGFTYRIDGWHIPIKRLKPPQLLPDYLRPL